MRNLKDQLELERRQWTDFHGKYKDFLDQFFILDQTRDLNLKLTPMWLNWTFNSVNRKKCLKEAQKALTLHMAISSKNCKNVKCFLAFFDKAKGGKIVLPSSMRC
jgi:hypothetical protein